jgi:phosphoglucomutase
MARLRTATPTEVAGIPVAEVVDYHERTRRVLADGSASALTLPASNVIQLVMANGDRITARPSGTEPKIKYYFNVLSGHLDEADRAEQYRRIREGLAVRVDAYREALRKY